MLMRIPADEGCPGGIDEGGNGRHRLVAGGGIGEQIAAGYGRGPGGTTNAAGRNITDL